jgi:protein tyrosine/serine phosphatase
VISRFFRVNDFLCRGSAPSPKDVAKLHKIGVRKIVSLDEVSGNNISDACEQVGIKQVKLPIGMDVEELKEFLSQPMSLFTSDGPTYVHCKHGKDRTGMAIGIFRIKHDRWSFSKTMEEALSFGFGVGCDPAFVKLYTDILRITADNQSDNSSAMDSAVQLSHNQDPGEITTSPPFMRRDKQWYSMLPELPSTVILPQDHAYRSDKVTDILHVDELDPLSTWLSAGGYNNSENVQGFGPVEPVQGWYF